MILRNKKKPKKLSIQKFVDDLYMWERNNPEELCPPPTDAQFVIECLKEEFLGPDWYTVLPISTKQVNTLILYEILQKHSKYFRQYAKNIIKKEDA